MKKIIEKYKNLPLGVKASIWFIFASLLQKGIAFITTPIFTRIMTPDQYGMFSVYQSWYSIILIFTSVNFSAGVYNKGLLKYENDRNNFTSSLLFATSIITLLFLIIYTLNISFFNGVLGLSTFFVVFMFIQLLFEPAYLLWSAKLRFDYKYVPLIFVSIVIALFTPLLGIIMVVSTEFKAEARILSYVLVQTAVFIIIYFSIFKKGKKFLNLNYVKYALKFNVPLIPHYLSMTILSQVDRLMIQHICGNNSVAIYSVAYSLSMIISIITTAINNSFIPFIYKSIKERKFHKISNITQGLVIFIGIFCFIPILLGPELILIMAGSKYYEAIWIIPPVSMSVYFIFLYNMFGTIEFYFEKNIFIMIASCFGAVLNIILNAIFIPAFGIVAAGYTTLICYIVFSVAHTIFYFKVLKDNNIKKIYNVRFMVLYSIVLIVIMIIFSLLYNYKIIRLTIMIIIFILPICFRNKIKDNLGILIKNK